MEALNPEREAHWRASFAAWLGQLGNDTEAHCRLLEQADVPDGARKLAAESLNHLLHSVDLIPEGVEALGYLEHVFAFRALAERALRDDPRLAAADPSGTLARLNDEAGELALFLGDEDHARLRSWAVRNARMARGRQLQELLRDAASDAPDAENARAAALEEARAWAHAYRTPSFGTGEQDLTKLRAFLKTRLARPL
jgi:hypothetical protein